MAGRDPGALAPLGRRWRWVLAAGALVAAAAHVPVIGPHLREAPYMGVLFVVLTWACFFLAAAAVTADDRVVYGLALLTCGLAILGYGATRLVAFPQLAGDVGRWREPLGIVSVLAETVVVIAAASVLRRRPSDAGSSGRLPAPAKPPSTLRRWEVAGGAERL
ncbi:MAG: hypothetical protein ABIS47_14060 [Acidimicrobiales bacterium]